MNDINDMSARRRVLMLIVPAALLTVAALLYALGGREISSDNAYAKALTVGVTMAISGRVMTLPVQTNQHVEKGELLLEIAPEDYNIAVRTAQADVYVQMARVEALRSEMREISQKLRRARDDVVYFRKEKDRFENLSTTQAISEAQLDEMSHRLAGAESGVAALEQEYRRVGVGLNYNVNLPLEKHPFYMAAVARLESAQLDLARTRVIALMSGVVANKNISEGDLVGRGRTVMTLVQDTDLWVEANLKETELTHVRIGQPVVVSFDAYPGVEYAGSVESISPVTGAEFALLPPQNASGNWVKVVQRVPVRIRVEASKEQPPLRAGLSAEVAIDTGRNRLQRFFFRNTSVN